MTTQMETKKTDSADMHAWLKDRVKKEQITKYMEGRNDFIDEDLIMRSLEKTKDPDPSWIREILQKSLSITMLEPHETAALINVADPELLAEMRESAYTIKKKVYERDVVILILGFELLLAAICILLYFFVPSY